MVNFAIIETKDNKAMNQIFLWHTFCFSALPAENTPSTENRLWRRYL